MPTAAAEPGIRFSTDALPERDRLSYLREAFGRSILGLDLQPFRDCPLAWMHSLHVFGGLRAVSGWTGGIISRRTRVLAARHGRLDYLPVRRASDGVLPKRRRNVRLKCDRSLNPAAKAIVLIVRAIICGSKSI